MWDNLWEFFNSLLSDEYKIDRVLMNLTLIGLSLLFALYLLFLFLPYKEERLKAYHTITLRKVELRKFREDDNLIRLQWRLIAEKMVYNDFRKKSLLFNGKIDIYSYDEGEGLGEPEVTEASFEKAYADELLKEVRVQNLKILYSKRVIYAREGELVRDVLYLRDLKILKDDVMTLSPFGKIKSNKLELYNPINIRVKE